MKIYNKKVISFFRNNYKTLLLLFLIFTSLAALLQFLFVEQAPEKAMVIELLKHNNAVQEYFGSLKEILYDRSMGASVSYAVDKKEGYFCYQIEGAKKKGIVEVDWQKNKTEGLQIKGIKVIVPEKRQLYGPIDKE